MKPTAFGSLRHFTWLIYIRYERKCDKIIGPEHVSGSVYAHAPRAIKPLSLASRLEGRRQEANIRLPSRFDNYRGLYSMWK